MAGQRVLAPDDPRHGRASSYTNWKCRCVACRAAWRDQHREYLHRTGRTRPAEVYRADLEEKKAAYHGTEGTYQRCKCVRCTAAATEARKQRRYATPDATRAYDREYRGYAPLRSVGDADEALIRRATEIDRLRGSVDGELAELFAEQLKDDQRFWIQGRWVVSLDSRRYDDGTTWHDSLSLGGAHLRSYQSDSWTDAVIAVVDRQREIDSWADEVAA